MSNSEFYPLIAPKKDGLLALESDSWILAPIKTLGNYLEVYSLLLSTAYNHRIYLDLSAGTGMLEMNNTGECIYDTSLLAFSSPVQFNRYIFWEPNETYAQALRVRIKRNFKDKNVLIISTSWEKFLEQVRNYVPINTKGIKPWIFCNVNPRFGFPEIHFFDSIESLDPVVFFTLAGEKKKFWTKLKSGKDDFELYARNHIRNIEKWTYENNFRIKGSFSLTESSKMNSLYYQGVLCRKASVSKVVTEVRRRSSNQIQLF
jgi:hypothetical protein